MVGGGFRSTGAMPHLAIRGPTVGAAKRMRASRQAMCSRAIFPFSNSLTRNPHG